MYQDFHVCCHVVQQWLEYLQEHHSTFQSRAVVIDYGQLNQLPEDGSVHHRLRSIEAQDLDDPAEDSGPLQNNDETGGGIAGNANDENSPLFSRGFVPNVNSGRTELPELKAAAFDTNAPFVLTMPSV